MVEFADSGFGGFDFFRGPDCSMSWGDPLFFATGAGIPIFQGILPGENSVNVPLGNGGPFGDIWQALGLPSGLSCPQVGGLSNFLCGGVNPIMDLEPGLHYCGDFVCDANNKPVRIAPPEILGLSEDTTVDLGIAGAAAKVASLGPSAEAAGYWLNQGRYWRIGWSRKGGLRVFRSVFFGWKHDWWTGGPL